MKNLIICGATGFIGKNLTLFYCNKKEYKIFATYNIKKPFECENVTWVKSDLREKDNVEKVLKDMDIVVQAAATTSGSKDIVSTPHIHVTDNILMNSLIFRTAHDYSIEKVIFFSCTVMYQSSELPLIENDFNANDEMYSNYFGIGWTKVYLEKQAEFFSRLGHTKYTIFRHTNVYGPHDKYDLDKSHVFGATMTKVMTNTSGLIDVWGSGETGRDLIYVDDMVDAVDKAINNQKSKYGLYNIGLGDAIMIKDLVQKIINASGKKIEMIFDITKPDIKTKLCVDYSKAKNEIKWEPLTSFEDGIKKTMQWYKKNILTREGN